MLPMAVSRSSSGDIAISFVDDVIVHKEHTLTEIERQDASGCVGGVPDCGHIRTRVC